MKNLFKNILFTLLVPGTVGFFVPYRIGARGAENSGWWHWLSLPFLLAGMVVLLLCIRDFMTKGEGTPFPLDPPRRLVTGRLYQYTRNPMYVGLFSALSGWVLWFSSAPMVVYTLAVVLIVNLFVILVEEPFLKKQFGDSYEEYCRRVPRWW